MERAQPHGRLSQFPWIKSNGTASKSTPPLGSDNSIDPHTLLWTGNTSFTLFAGFTLAAITLIAAGAFITTQQDL